jgi:predicted hydrocarbon binding protein
MELGATMEKTKYQFSWDLLGDIALGRPNLGHQTRIEVYRLMQFCFRDVIEKTYGTEAADNVFYEAGYLAGQHFYQNLIGPVSDLDEFIRKLQALLKELQIGIMRVEEADLEQGRFVITISEDLDCSGLPEMDFEICTYDEGFIAALLESYSGKCFQVKEVDCWCTGDRTCRFVAQAMAV